MKLKNHNKYNNRKIEIDGYIWDSQKEGDYYAELKIRKVSKDIRNFMIKPRFELQPKFISSKGKAIRAICIEPDFLLTHNDGTKEFVDTKGYWTDTSKLKWKMFQYNHRHDKNIKFTIV